MGSITRSAPLLLAGLLFAGALQAEDAVSTLVVEPFTHSRLVDQRLQTQADQPVVIGSIRRINNQLRAEREVRASGDLASVSWEILDGYEPEVAFSHLLGQLLEQPHTLLYACDGRECGSSSLWANQVLHNSRLYGPDEDQRYLALRLDAEPQRFITLYSITRGNRRSYLNMTQLTPDQPVQQALYPTPSTLLKVLRSENSLALPSLQDPRLREDWTRLLVRMMRLDSLLRLQLDGGDAPQLVNDMKAAGVAASRMQLGEPVPAEGAVLQRIR
ncbi:MAG: DUF4892 domain-containing protein [Pseudomonadales bacterium]|nr:DUF4892 domain-containing protein [Pseudomonadales bacterium]HCB42357.1 DUF4892 domain-containing protein [Pseudomonas sp.]|tara:strand:+ start:233 stop:1051 length:819 start_codon:yes stop_codon:yes gene_type:complete